MVKVSEQMVHLVESSSSRWSGSPSLEVEVRLIVSVVEGVGEDMVELRLETGNCNQEKQNVKVCSYQNHDKFGIEVRRSSIGLSERNVVFIR